MCFVERLERVQRARWIGPNAEEAKLHHGRSEGMELEVPSKPVLKRQIDEEIFHMESSENDVNSLILRMPLRQNPELFNHGTIHVFVWPFAMAVEWGFSRPGNKGVGHWGRLTFRSFPIFGR